MARAHSGSASLYTGASDSSSLLKHPGGQWRMAEVLWPLPATWKTRMEFLTPSSGLSQIKFLRPFGDETNR